MNGLLSIAVTVGGGLGAFLLGMRHLSDGLQSAGGEGVRKFMALAAGNRPLGVFTGFASTIVVQSSSIVAVMLVGFVVSGLMPLANAIYVLAGANVGTTFTVWLMALSPSPELVGLALFAIGSLVYFPIKNHPARYVGLALQGLGLVFVGMFLMKEGVAPIKESPALLDLLARLDARSLASAALVAALAAAFTAVIQSSAAGIVIFMTFAVEGLISYETAVVALFGTNVGTTATGWLAAIGGGNGAKRLALAHTLTNLVGSVVFLPLALPVFAPLGRWLCDALSLPLTVPIALTDTLFAVLRALLTLPAVPVLVKFLNAVLPDSPHDRPHLSALNPHAAISTAIACGQASQEVGFMAESIDDLAASLRLCLLGKADADTEKHIFNREEVLDRVQSEVTVFLGGLMVKNLAPDSAVIVKRLLRLADVFESISDEFPAILKALRRLKSSGAELSGSDLAVIVDVHDCAAELSHFAPESLHSSVGLAARRQISAQLKEKLNSVRQLQLMRLGVGDGDVAGQVLAMLDILNSYNRIRSYCINIAETCAGAKNMV